MKTYVLDSHALLAFFERDKGWEKVAALLHDASADRCRLFLSMINWGETFYVTLREYGEDHAENVLNSVKLMPVVLVEANKEHVLQAARLKAGGGMSYAECFAASLAMMKKGEVVTGDREFKAVEGKVRILWL